MKNKLLNILKAFILPIAVWCVFSIITKGTFANSAVFLSILRTAVVPMLLAMGLSFGMQMGLWNFAVGANIYASAILSAYISEILHLGIIGVCIFSIVICVFLSGFMGMLYRLLRIPCLVLSLGMVMAIEALPGLVVPNATAKISLMDGYLGTAPWCYLILAIMFVIFYYINTYTTFGANIRAIGANVQIAKSAGIDVDRVKFMSFLISGVFLGVAGIVFMSNSISLTGVIGFASASMLFDGLMGIFIAFVLTRYINFNVAVMIGTFTIRMLSSGLTASGLSSEVRGMLTGLFLLVVVTYSANSGILEQLKIRKKIAVEANIEFTKQLV